MNYWKVKLNQGINILKIITSNNKEEFGRIKIEYLTNNNWQVKIQSLV